MSKIKILAFLQNQWFKDPERIRKMYEESPQHRNSYIRSFLFMGCLTGRRLSHAFGDEICQQHIIWDEISPQIGGYASSSFPADLYHIESAIIKHQPTVIIALGKPAKDALEHYDDDLKVIFGPHPAARNNPMPRLFEIGAELNQLVSKENK